MIDATLPTFAATRAKIPGHVTILPLYQTTCHPLAVVHVVHLIKLVMRCSGGRGRTSIDRSAVRTQLDTMKKIIADRKL